MDMYWFRSRTTQTAQELPVQGSPTAFSAGTYTVPADGVYYMSAFARCEQQACDCTVR